MTVKSEVQGIVQALFGAYAGGYLAELTAEATANGTTAVAARLASVQGIILGKDLSTTKAFVDTILGNMGVSSTNAAYAAASKWATDELTAGASRADVVSAAVAFLSGIAAGTIVDTKYAAIATAFAAKVTAGVTYSETAAGAKVLSVTALQTAAGFTAPTNLTDALSAVDTAKANLKGFFAGLDLDFDKEPDYTAADIKATGFVAAADADLDAALIAKALPLAGIFNIASSVAVNTASLALEEATLDSNLETAQKELAAAQKTLTTFEATTDGNGATKAVNELVAATAAGKVTQKALDAADAALAGAIATLITNIDDLEAVPLAVVPNTSITLDLDQTAAPNSTDVTLATYDGNAKIYKLATGVTETTFPGVTAYVAAFNAQAAAAKADTAADQVTTAKQLIVTNWVGDADAATVGQQTLASLATTITTKTTAVTTAEKAITAFDKAVVELNAVIALDDQRTVLEKAVAATEKAITDSGFAVNNVDGVSDIGTAKNDVFVFTKGSGDETISLFGTVGNDVLYIGSNYALNTGKVATAGVDTQLEVFITANAASAGSTDVTIETSAFGSNVGAGLTPEVEIITLVGVTAAQVTFANGYITLA